MCGICARYDHMFEFPNGLKDFELYSLHYS